MGRGYQHNQHRRQAAGVLVHLPEHFDSAPRAQEWIDSSWPLVCFTPSRVVAESAPALPGLMLGAGVYFLLRDRKICYVGRSNDLHARVQDHRRNCRPFDAVAVIAGIPPGATPAVEYAYWRAWAPPWNAADVPVRLRDQHPLLSALSTMDLAPVCALPEVTRSDLQRICEAIG